jgi:hypothetical protein
MTRSHVAPTNDLNKKKQHGETYKTTIKDTIPPYLTSKLCSLLSIFLFFLIEILFAPFFSLLNQFHFHNCHLEFWPQRLREKEEIKYIHVEGNMYCVHLSILPQKLGFLTK